MTKNLVLVFTIVISIITTACSNSGKKTTANTNIKPIPVATTAPKIQTSADLKAEQIEEVKRKWSDINNPKNQFLDEVKGIRFCSIEVNYQEIRYFYEGMPNPNNPKGSYGYENISYEDLGIKQDDVLNKYQDATKRWFNALMQEFSKPKLSGCSIGEGGYSYADYTDITDEIENLATNDSQHLELIKGSDLRMMWLKAFQKDIAIKKQSLDKKSEVEDLVKRAVEDYKFEEKELYLLVKKSPDSNNIVKNSNQSSNINNENTNSNKP